MKAISKLSFVAVVVALSAVLGGCASTSPDTVVDTQKMAAVNDWARLNNTQVIWLSSPTRRADVAPTKYPAAITSLSPVLR